MNGTTIAGLVVMLIGGLLMSDYKSMGMSNPSIGVLTLGAGFFISAFGYFNQSQNENREGSGRKVRDHSV